MTYPTISISINAELLKKLKDLMEVYRKDDETTSRSEVVCIAIDALHAAKCPLTNTTARSEVQGCAA